MIGTIINVLAIIVGTVLGLIFRRWVKKDICDSVLKAVGLVIIVISILAIIKNAITIEDNIIKTNFELLLLISIVIGTFIGEMLKIDELIIKFGNKLEARVNKSMLSIGFVNATMIFCVGAMAITGAIEAAFGNYQILYIKAILDGITALVLATTLGFGVLLSSVVVLIYQGLITFFAVYLKPFMSHEFISAFSVVGYTLVLGLGINFIRTEKIKVANMIPSLFLVILYFIIFK
jgi:uncharacterized membrane protein YqgA involved in biofilm formation